MAAGSLEEDDRARDGGVVLNLRLSIVGGKTYQLLLPCPKKNSARIPSRTYSCRCIAHNWAQSHETVGPEPKPQPAIFRPDNAENARLCFFMPPPAGLGTRDAGMSVGSQVSMPKRCKAHTST
jgi:hypothetical protein